MERKLTAILSADVEGYSRLMGEDEEATVKTLNTYRDAMSRLIEEHQGRVIDSPGDNILAEFTSAVNAVQCAVVIQAELRARNMALAEDRRMNFRIGVNLGDVIVDGDRIYGDGVNVAARVESLAEGGGICVSGTVYDQVVNKLSYAFDNLGEHTVKNIAEPVRVYAVRWDVEKASTGKDNPSRRGVWSAAVVIVAVFAVIGIGLVFWDKGKVPQKSTGEETTPPTLPETPSIAVLPFRDMSPEKDQEYFCEGMAEEILNVLAKIEGLRVASRTSSFRIRDLDISTIGEQLNVKTVLEGSVRKEGNQIRVTAQLNNAAEDIHIWSENYDRELKNVFAIQDEIAQAITKVLKVKLMGEAGDPLVKHHTEHIEAYDQYLLGRYLLNKRGGQDKQTEKDLMAAKKHFEQAITLDPNYALAYSGLADVYLILPSKTDVKFDVVKAQAEEAVKKALTLDPDLAEAHSSFGHLRRIYYHDSKGAAKEYRRAIELNPKYATAHYRYSMLLRRSGDMEGALVEARKAYELEPFSTFYSVSLGWAFVIARQYDAAIRQFERTLELDSNYSNAWRGLGVAFLYDKRFEEATRAFVRDAELEGVNKEAMQLFVSLVEEHERTGEPVSPTPELEVIFAKTGQTHILYAGLGHKEKTLAFLEQKYEEENYLPLFFPVLDFLRAEPRFIALERKHMQFYGLEE